MEKTITTLQKREAADSVLAKNLVIARLIANMTQHELAARSLISRATIAQIETGSSDPRLSTINHLAAALNLPPLFLLAGREDVQALSALYAAAGGAEVIAISDSELDRMKRLIKTGMLKDRLHVARLAAALARKAGRTHHIAVAGAAIFSAVDPGAATQVGALLGDLASGV